MQQMLEYGPYTPQEVERITQWLKSNQVEFQLTKDAESEKLQMMNDGKNIVEKAEFRTSIYLGQIFYVQISTINDSLKAEFEKQFQQQKESFSKERFTTSESEDQNLVNQGSRRQNMKKRTWAIILSLLFVIPIILTIIKIFSEKGL